MTRYIINRILTMIPTVILISFLCFFVIQLPPGDVLSHYQSQLLARGDPAAHDQLDRLRVRYGLDKSMPVQFWKWISNIVLRGDFGHSFMLGEPVAAIVWKRTGWTLLLALLAVALSLIGLPIGIYSATHQYSFGDYAFTLIGFIGLSIPNFFLVLLLMFVMVFYFGSSAIGGLFSSEYLLAPWSIGKLIDLLKHIWIPIVVVGTAGMAGNIRIMRANLLDVLQQEYVRTARSKGLRERKVVYKHAVKNAMHPVIMSLGMMLPVFLQGEIVTAIVANVPTMGPIFFRAVLAQDMYLAVGFLLLTSVVLVVGNLLADIALVWLDPRVKYD